MSMHAYYEPTATTSPLPGVRGRHGLLHRVRRRDGRRRRAEAQGQEDSSSRSTNGTSGTRPRTDGRTNLEWVGASPHRGQYSVTDAVVVGTLLNSLLRHGDRVWIAYQAQLVNVIAPITNGTRPAAWRQTTFYPFALTARYAQGNVLRVVLDTPQYETALYGEVPVTDVVATRDDGTGDVAIFAVNRSQNESATLHVALHAFPGMRVVEHLSFGGDASDLTNNESAPTRAVPQACDVGPVGVDGFSANMQPQSWNLIRLALSST